MSVRGRAGGGRRGGHGETDDRRRAKRSAPNGATSSEPRIVGHGELLKALDDLPGINDARYRVAARYLSHCAPPDYTVYVKTATIAQKVGRSNRHVERCRAWLLEQAIRIVGGRGRGRSTLVDFTPLAERVKRDSMRSHFPSDGRKNATAAPENATASPENATATTLLHRAAPEFLPGRTLLQGPLHKDRADARAGALERARSPAAPKLTDAGRQTLDSLVSRYGPRQPPPESENSTTSAATATGIEGAKS